MPNRARPAGTASKARLLRSAQRSDSCMARSISSRARRQLDAFVELHGDVGAEQVWISIARSGDSATVAPSRCERNVTPFSSSLRSSAQRHDLEAAGIGQDRMRPVHEFVQTAERRNALGARAQHQVIGIGRARYRRRSPRTSAVVTPFTVACVPTGMKAGVRTTPCGVVISPTRAAPSVAKQAEGQSRSCSHLRAE